MFSPAAGTVITWDLEARLKERPVARGQELMRVGDLGGQWQLELHMPEDRLGPWPRASTICPNIREPCP